jgi:hypothetical protein
MGAFIDYHGIDVRSPDPTGDAGLVLNNNFKELADRVAPVHTAGADPTINDDEIDTAGNGKFYIWSKWLNTASGALFVCTDSTATAAVWTHFHCGTDTLTLNGTQVLYLPDQIDFDGTLIVGDGGTNLSTVASPDGKYNTVVGLGAFDANTEGDSNNVIGYQALEDNTVGVRNIAIGYRALRKNIDGDNNVAIGDEALLDNTTGSQNVCIGALAGEDITGDGNICIGYMAGEGQIAISNKLYIDNSDTASPLIYGEFDNDLIKINGDLYIPSDTKKLYLGADSTDYTIQWDGSDAVHTITAGDFVFSGGNIGINEVAPQDKLEVNGTVLIKDKLIFTQDDRDEYIDSLNDGFIDYGATTAHRFLNHIKLTDDDRKIYFGIDDNGSICYNGSHLTLNPKEVGAGSINILGKMIESHTFTATTTGEEIYKITSTDSSIQTAGMNRTLVVDHTISGAKSGTADNEGISCDMALSANTHQVYAIAAYIAESGGNNHSLIEGMNIYLEDMGVGTLSNIVGLDIGINSTNVASGRHCGMRVRNHSGTATDVILVESAFVNGLNLSGATFSAADIKLQHGETISNLVDGTINLGGHISIPDAKNIILDTTTGTKIGTATNQKLGFFNKTPVIQQTFTAISDPPTQAEVVAIRDALINLGLMASS